ncbi:MAG: 8-oxo-dGTP diphosphatase [Anaerolineaceae bacterium]|nr:8-oxo-dGTP diphosphatase [Anaerolineaceae bacterium]
MIEATICMICRGKDAPDAILLGEKKTGFGKGKFTCYGGKLEPGESPLACVRREVREETLMDVNADAFEHMGRIVFEFPAKPEWDFICHLFRLCDWQGVPRETREMRPNWFSIDLLPLDAMWADNPHWFPMVLRGEMIDARFTYADDNENLAGYQIINLSALD